MSKSKVKIVGHLVEWNIGARFGMQQTRRLQDALIFSDRKVLRSILIEGIDKVGVKVRSRSDSGCRGATTTVVKVVLFALGEFTIPKGIRWWIRCVVGHPEHGIRVVDR